MDLLPGLHSGPVHLPQVPVGTVHVEGTSTVAWSRATDLCIFPLYQKLSCPLWIYFSEDSGLKLSQRSNSANNGLFLTYGRASSRTLPQRVQCHLALCTWGSQPATPSLAQKANAPCSPSSLTPNSGLLQLSSACLLCWVPVSLLPSRFKIMSSWKKPNREWVTSSNVVSKCSLRLSFQQLLVFA